MYTHNDVCSCFYVCVCLRVYVCTHLLTFTVAHAAYWPAFIHAVVRGFSSACVCVCHFESLLHTYIHVHIHRQTEQDLHTCAHFMLTYITTYIRLYIYTLDNAPARHAEEYQC